MRRINIKLRMAQVALLSRQSKCLRRGVGALIVSEDDTLLSEGYNGMFRGGANTCGEREGECLRIVQGVQSGCSAEIGCLHAEANALLSAARLGRSTVGATLVCSLEPCAMCAKMIVAAGIRCVFVGEELGTGGRELMEQQGLEVHIVDSSAT